MMIMARRPSPATLTALAAAAAALAAVVAAGGGGGGEDRTAAAQSAGFADHIVINEVDTNPPGDDSLTIAEWVEIHNPTSKPVSLARWQIASTTGLEKTLTLPSGTVIGPGQFLTYSYLPSWFGSNSESVELRSPDGAVVDATPVIDDHVGDSSSWHRVYDALDSDSDSDWSFGVPTIGFSNGRQEQVRVSDPVVVTISPGKQSYMIGETVTLAGNVSKKVFVEKPTFMSEKIVLTVSGPGYRDIITKYPDINLEYSTSIRLQRVLGTGEGTYAVTAEYAGSKSSTSFTVGHQAAAAKAVEREVLSVWTDLASYLPGQTVSIFASTSKEVPFAGLDFSVTDPDGRTIAQGMLFPGAGARSGGPESTSPDGKRAAFATTVFVDTVAPVFGEYRIEGRYASQSAESTFMVSPDVKDLSVAVSLRTDKPVYEPGDTILVSGRSNLYYVPTLSIEVVRTANTALDASGGAAMKILDDVRLAGDGTFAYEIPLPASFDGFGEYRVTVSGEIGTFDVQFTVAGDAGSFVAVTEPLSVAADMESYRIGDDIVISGIVRDQARRTSLEAPSVHIDIRNADGTPLTIVGVPDKSQLNPSDRINVALSYTAVPDTSGKYAVGDVITRSFFTPGVYTIHARYLTLESDTSIRVTDPINVTDSGLTASLDRDVYGLGSTVRLTGSLPASADKGVVLTLYKPDGDTDKFGAVIDGGLFSWEWRTPDSSTAITTSNKRVVTADNLGIYRLNVEVGGNRADLLFKVSSDPKNDPFGTKPITLATSKSIYRPGDLLEVSGTVATRPQARDGTVAPELVGIRVIRDDLPVHPVYEATVYPRQDGGYSTSFKLPATAASAPSDGGYKVRASYAGDTVQTAFLVAGDPPRPGTDGSAAVTLLLSLDRKEYHPGDTVTVTGRPSTTVYVDAFDVGIIKQSEFGKECGLFYCGKHAQPVSSVRPDQSAGFTYTYTIPDSYGLGPYEVTASTGFAKKSILFTVVEDPANARPSKVIDKKGRITGQEISITPRNMSDAVDGGGSDNGNGSYPLVPRTLSGSLLAVRGQESAVNLMVASPGGTCIIGPSEECLVSGSTRTRGSVFSTVEFDGGDYRVRYTGPDVGSERFTILPAGDDGGLPTEPFLVSVLKEEGDQKSKFYYKIVYLVPDG